MARPPVWRRLLYGLGFRLPERYDDWVFRDLTGRGWRVREALRIMVIALPFTIGSFFLPGELALRELTASFFVFGPALIALAYSDEFRDYRLRQHGLLPPSGPDPD
ncbi:MAG: DUF5313 family protein [Jatrophihabitantaceae bacterium]